MCVSETQHHPEPNCCRCDGRSRWQERTTPHSLDCCVSAGPCKSWTHRLHIAASLCSIYCAPTGLKVSSPAIPYPEISSKQYSHKTKYLFNLTHFSEKHPLNTYESRIMPQLILYNARSKLSAALAQILKYRAHWRMNLYEEIRCSRPQCPNIRETENFLCKQNASLRCGGGDAFHAK